MPKTRLILLRHGEAEWNIEGRYQGQLDSALTAAGRRQAEALAVRLARRQAAALYSSDLGRAQQTARLAADACRLPVILDSRLREQHLGMFQGLLKSDIREKFPAEYRCFKADADYIVPGGESARQFSDRVIACLEEIVSRHTGQEIVVVTHGGPVGSLLCHTFNIPLRAPRSFERPNASWNVFLFENGRWRLETWGDASHLEPQLI